MNSQNDSSAIRSANEQIHTDAYAYFASLTASTISRAIVSSPRLDSLQQELRLVFLTAALERILYVTSYRLEKDKTDIIIEHCLRFYSNWHTAEWRYFYSLCTMSHFGRLEAYDRENPQILFDWMNTYNRERSVEAENARIYLGID